MTYDPDAGASAQAALPEPWDSTTVATPYGAGLAELSLATGGLALGTGEFASMGLLPNVAHGMGVSIPDAGHMISAYALGVVVGAPLITIALARAPRRLMLIGLMVVFALGNMATAAAPTFMPLILARFLAGLPHGAYFGIASLVAASLVPPGKRAQAVGRVMVGLSVANVVGVPLATWFGQMLGWRAAFLAVAALGLLTATMVNVFVPSIPTHAEASPARELAGFTRVQVWLTLAIAAVGFGGMFAVYSYITPILTRVSGVPMHHVPLFLSVMGLGMIAGSLAGGWFADRSILGTVFGALLWNAVMLGLITVSASHPWAAVANLFLIGGGIAVVPALQTRLMDTAAEAQTLAAAMNHSAFNMANALGAWLGGVVIAAGLGWTSTGWVGATLALAALPILGLSALLDRKAEILA